MFEAAGCEALRAQVAEVADLLGAMSLLGWDSQVNMPEGGAVARGRQEATLKRLVQARLVSPELEAALTKAEQVGGDEQHQRAIDALRAARDYFARMPVALLAEESEVVSLATPAWRRAKQARDFSLFAPHLKRIVDLKRRFADVMGYEAHPYDALLNSFEPGARSADLLRMFEQIKVRLVPLAKRVHAAPKPDTAFMSLHYDVAAQREVAKKMAAIVGYDFDRGRLDEAPHPFAQSVARGDCRITTRFDANDLDFALFSTLHECGHAMYEQNIDPALEFTPLGMDMPMFAISGGISSGVHESQSRLWENRVGRSLPFWTRHYGVLQSAFPAQLGELGLADFYRAINCSVPSLVRVSADELTYDLHIMLRTEVEIALLEGTLDVDALPAYWNEKMQAYLGVQPAHDGEGVLQDIHWSIGLFGYFPTYTLGNVMASQLFDAAMRDAAVAKAAADGEYAPLLDWLRANVHGPGRTYTAAEMLQRATGGMLSVAPYLDYMERKFGGLYGV